MFVVIDMDQWLMSLRLLVIFGVFLLLSGCGGPHLPKPRVSSDDEEPAAPPVTAVASATPKPQPDYKTASPAEPAANIHVVPATSSSKSDPGFRPEVGGLPEIELRKRVYGQITRIGQAFEAYRTSNGGYPLRRLGSHGGLSWRVLLLPKLGCTELYTKFNLAEPWDSPHNKALLKEIPDVYKAAERTDGKTHLLCVTGPGTAYETDEGLSDDTCPDGLENTIFVVEVADQLAVPWTAPVDYVFNPGTVQQDLFGLRKDCCLVMVGGSVGPRRIEANIPDDNLLALLTPAGGEQVLAKDASNYPHPTVDLKLIEDLRSNPIVRFNAKPDPSDRTPAETALAKVAPRVGSRVPAGATRDRGPMNAPQDNRLPPPSEDKIDSAANAIRDIFGDEFKAAKTLNDRRAFAKKMLDEANKISGDPVGCFVLCRAARDTAAVSGDVTVAFQAVDQICGRFRCEPLAMKSSILQLAASNLQNETEADLFVTHSMEVSNQLLANDSFDEAKRILGFAMTTAKRANKQELVVRVTNQMDRFDELRQAYRRVSEKIHTVVRDPSDASANAAVGKYLALVKNDWPRGLEMLGRGDDPSLRDLAEFELTATNNGTDALKIADGWWDFSQKTRDELERSAARNRAKHWYQKALSTLPASLDKIRAEKRIRDESEELKK